MATCLVCGEPATVALHAISTEEPKPAPHKGTFHYTELVVACDAHKGQPDLILAKLPDGYEWSLQNDAAPIASCPNPECGRERHPEHIWKCPECGREGCSGCMMRYDVTGTCGECIRPIHDAAAKAAVDEHPDMPGASDRQQSDLSKRRAEHSAKVVGEGIAALAEKHGGTG